MSKVDQKLVYFSSCILAQVHCRRRVHKSCQCESGQIARAEEQRGAMHFSFTKLPDTFELGHYFCQTVFQKMSCLTWCFFFFFFFQSSCRIANRSRPLDESATSESINTVMSCHAVSLSLWKMTEIQPALHLRMCRAKPWRVLV